ncbi:MAG: hypothetical protein IJT44_07485 [Clostridia bacterium]|nr:hypothetical protein [Clostridia bacterium]
MKDRKNKEIRETARAAGVRLWQIADDMGVSEATLIRKLRHELPEAEKQEVLSVIHRISEREG